MTITLRQESQAGTTTKGSTLTYTELDNNFIDLLTNKILPLQVNADTGTVTVGQSQSNGVFTITGDADKIETTVTEDSTGNANLSITLASPFVTDLYGAVTFEGKNTSGGTIEPGQVVYISGISGNTPEIQLARANADATMPAFGMATETITNTSTGTIATFGSKKGLDAADYVETGITLALGDVVYISSSEAGKVTNVAPTGESNRIQNIGKVERASPTTNMTIKVGGAGRTNATPALNDGNIFIGNSSNVAVTTSLQTQIESYSINNVVEDTTPQLGGTLDAQSNNLTSVGTINTHTIPGGTGTFALTSDIPTVPDTQIVGGDNIDITQPDSASGWQVAFRNPLNQPVVAGDQTFSQINLKDYSETIYTGGSTTGTITPDVANGNVQSITLTGSITFNAFNSPAAGQSMTLIIRQPSSGGPYTLTSTMKFAGGTKTLSTTADAYDIMTVFYDGTNYFASLSTNFS